MPGCCAWGCTNRPEKGAKLYRFPTNPKRRKLWEAHFSEDQFEKNRTDGKKKLKFIAVPTIFPHRKTAKSRKPPVKRILPGTEKPEQQNMAIIDHDYCYPDIPSQPNSSSDEAGASSSNQTVDISNQASEIRLKNTVHDLKVKLRRVRKEKRDIFKSKLRQESKLSGVFSVDQLQSLGRKSSRGVKWSDCTVKKALQLRFACGSSGYDLLLKQNLPYPSIRTLQRRMKNVSFRPGILSQVFEFLQLKVSGMRSEERICCLTLDEMALTASVEYDPSSGKVLGDVSLPDHSGIATHALVFMIGGVTSRWKQTVAYHYTGNSTNGDVLKPLILDIIRKCTSIGLHVVAITSDMGSANRAMWRCFGITCGKFCRTVNKVPHPSDLSKWLYFLADVPHLIKNLKAALVNGHTFTLPDEVLSSNGLTSREVSIKHIQQLANYQQDKDLKLAPNLSDAVFKPSHFEKMKVSNALNLFSHSVSSALRYLVENEGQSKSLLTTSWYLASCNHWFDLMSSRHPVLALSYLNPEKHTEAVTFLQSFIKLTKALKIGCKGDWKPVQTGIILSTTSVLELQKELLDKGHTFLLTSRLTQDCLENLFSSVRLKNPVPSPLEFKFTLKIISISQFLKTSNVGSYQQDDSEYLAEFLSVPCVPPVEKEDTEITFQDSACELLSVELNSLYYLAGYCVSKVKKNEQHCDSCIREVMTDVETTSNAAKLTKLKDYGDNCLVYVSDKVFNIIKTAELMFRGFTETDILKTNNIKRVLMNEALLRTNAFELPQCHDIKHKILSRFINVRLNIYCTKLRDKRKKELQLARNGGELGSKSMTMRKVVKNIK